MSRLTSDLYNLSRTFGKAASIITDVETLASCNPAKIIRRAKRKAVSKAVYKTGRTITRKIK